MNTIYKYPISMDGDVTTVQMPADAQILTVQVQRGTPCIWAIVDASAPTVKRCFELYVTGQEIDATYKKYVGTVQSPDQMFVLHVFEDLL